MVVAFLVVVWLFALDIASAISAAAKLPDEGKWILWFIVTAGCLWALISSFNELSREKKKVTYNVVVTMPNRQTFGPPEQVVIPVHTIEDRQRLMQAINEAMSS